ncbi:small-conductance mechanosensitive channel [Leptolyngbyaceae cyanobacterium JSC-12]|nr:small-conductance mechanosensitive channel [Leptolyngbyaceae cyanobacterium JSC-12]
MNIWQDNLLNWALALAIGFPLAELVLGEVIHALKQQGNALAPTLRIIRNLFIPVLVLLLFLTHILQLDSDGQVVKFVETLFWICAIHTALSLVNVVVFAETESDSEIDNWKTRIPKLFRDLARFFLVMVGTAIVLSATWDIDLAGLVTALGVGSIVLGLALQDTLGSIVSGIALLFERPFNVGDWLKVGDAIGKVTDINWRAVRLETIDNYQINIPHLIIGKETIINYSEPIRAHEEEVFLRFSLNHPPNFVKQVLKATALSTPGVLAEPEVEVETAAYEDFGILYRVTFYIEDYQQRLRIRDEFQTRVWYANQRYNLRIPFPVREIYPVDNPNANTEQTSNKVTKSLESIPVLVRMEPDSLEDLARGAILHNFAAGEEVISEGDPVKALHLILAGKASVTVKTETGHIQEIFSLSRGDFFGEMALFTGQPSTVSIRAIEDLEVILIYSDIATMLIERKPSLAREIGQIMEARSKVINSVKQEAGNGKSS